MGRLTRVRLQQPREQRYPVLQVHAGSFDVSVIHQTVIWTVGSLTCIRDHSCACVYTQGLGTPTASQHNIFDSEKLSQIFLVLLTRAGFEPLILGSRVRRSTNRATPSPHDCARCRRLVHRSLLHFVCTFYIISRPDMTFAVDWALKNQLSIYLHLVHFTSWFLFQFCLCFLSPCGYGGK